MMETFSLVHGVGNRRPSHGKHFSKETIEEMEEHFSKIYTKVLGRIKGVESKMIFQLLADWDNPMSRDCLDPLSETGVYILKNGESEWGGLKIPKSFFNKMRRFSFDEQKEKILSLSKEHHLGFGDAIAVIF